MATSLRSVERSAPTAQPGDDVRENDSGASHSPGEVDATTFGSAVEDDELEAVARPEATECAVDWSELVARIQHGDDTGMEDLYRLFARGIRFYLCRQLGMQELDDKVHDTFLIVVQAIRRGDLREPDRLMGFVRTVVRRQVAAHIDQVVHSRRDEMHLDVGVRVADGRRNPEQNMAYQQKADFMREILRQLSDRDREILTRFYLHEETQEEICTEMGLTETQFRLLKSRAKARFGELGRRRLQQKPLVPYFSRASAR
jgi:RNA polymerase sigma-70 factor (ECF subfamily)